MESQQLVATNVALGVIFLVVFFALSVQKESFVVFDPDQYIISRTENARVREFGKVMRFSETQLFGVMFRRVGTPFLLYDNAGRNAFSAKVNPAHPASYVFADLVKREQELANEVSTTPLFQQMGVYWDKAGTNFIPVLWGNVFHGTGPTPDLRVEFKHRFKVPQTIALLQRIALYVQRSEDLTPGLREFCRETSATVLSNQAIGDMLAAEQGRAMLANRGCEQVPTATRFDWLSSKVRAMEPVIWLEASGYAGGVWRDSSGNGNDVTAATGARILHQAAGSSGAGRGFNFVGGDVNAGLLVDKGWPQGDYTFVHVTKYNGPTKNRIWQSATQNWLSGHWRNSAGVAYHNTWMHYSNSANVARDNWLLGISSTRGARFNRGALVSRRLNRYADRVKAVQNPAGLAINTYANNRYASDERSDWGVAEVLVFPRELTSTDVTLLEEYLCEKLALSF
jgi:hypothetical protein